METELTETCWITPPRSWPAEDGGLWVTGISALHSPILPPSRNFSFLAWKGGPGGTDTMLLEAEKEPVASSLHGMY